MESKNQLAVAETLTAEKLQQYLNIAGVATKLTPQERLNFIEIAQAFQLNPFKREIYCNSYGEGEKRQTSIITGYEVYIKRAERTGKLNGWEVKVEGTMPNLKALITIYRKDWDKTFTHEVYFDEVCQRKKDGRLNSIWAKMPKFMTKKVAIAQGFRLCFSDELGGMPYTADELPQEEKESKPVEIKAEVVDTFENEKAKIAEAKTEQELKDVCNKLLQKYPAEKKNLIQMFNKRLAEIIKEVKNENNI